MLFHVVVVDDDVKPGRVLLVFRDLGKVERPQLRKHADHGGPVVRLVLNRVPVKGQAVEVGQLLELADVCEPLDLVAVQVKHLEGLELQDVVAHLGDVVKAQVEPSDVFGKLNHVKGHLQKENNV
jgi:hypothetical protein